MSSTDVTHEPTDTAAAPDPLAPPEDERSAHAPVSDVEVRRNGILFAVMGLVCLALGLAYLVRGTDSGGAFTWLAVLVLGGFCVAMALSWAESRTPMLVADTFGIRIRLGREWRGLPWSSLEQVVVEPRTSILHDGRLVVVPADMDAALEGLDARGRRQVALSQKVYGAALGFPLGMTTRVSVPKLVDALAELSGTRSAVVELAGWARQPVVPMDADHLERREARALQAAAADDGARMGSSRVAQDRFERKPGAFEGLSIFEDLASSVRKGVGRGVSGGMSFGVSTLASRFEQMNAHVAERDVCDTMVTGHAHDDLVMVDGTAALQLEATEVEHDAAPLPEVDEPHRHDEASHVSWDVAPVPVSTPDPDPEPEPVFDPEIGPRLRRAREQLGYDVRSLAERTRIQPRVIEAIEVDDFGPCGGDFYARGHLRSLCAVLGVPAVEVVQAFDSTHASAPVDAKRVFGAELATGHPREGSGRRWATVLVVVLTLVLTWGVARLFTAEPQALGTPALNGSAGLASQREPITSIFGSPVNMSVRGVGGSSKVVVRDHTGAVLWTGTLRPGARKQLAGVGPFAVTAEKPDRVEVWVDGKDRGTVVADNAVVGKQTRTFTS